MFPNSNWICRIAVLGLFVPVYALALGPNGREAFARERAREAIQILNSAITNPELRDEEVRGLLIEMTAYVNRNGIRIATPKQGEFCVSSGGLAYVASDRPQTIVLCPMAYRYDNPQYVIHELYHVIFGNPRSVTLQEECMADLVSGVATLIAIQPEDLPITVKTIPGSYRSRCGEKFSMREAHYHWTLEEQRKREWSN